MKRLLRLLLGAALLLALPLATQLAVSGYSEFRAAQERLAQVEAAQMQRQRLADLAAERADLAEIIGDFVITADAHGIRPEQWVELEVRHTDRELDLEAFVELIESLRHGEGRYFEPKRLELRLNDRPARALPLGSARDGVRVSLEGTYLVFDPQ